MFLRCLLSGIFFFVSSVIVSQVITSPDQPMQSGRTDLPPLHTWKEMEKERTLYSRSWLLPDGRIVYQYSKRPICFYGKDGGLLPVDLEVHECPEGWIIPAQQFPTMAAKDGSTSISVGNGALIRFNTDCRMNGKKAFVAPVRTGKNIRFNQFFPGVDKEIILRENGFKTSYILHSLPVMEGEYIEFSEVVSVPNGHVFTRLENGGKEENGGWSGDLSLLNSKNEEIARFTAPVCFDASGKWITGTWALDLGENAGEKRLILRIPAQWLRDPERTFPVVIDPLVIGPTAMWTGGQMPSCIVPQYNADSIQVTVPAGISIIGLYVTSSYYANPFTTAVMADGALRFRSSCATSTTFTVAPPQGNTPGTAYLDSFDLKNPMMCCMQNSCSTRTFWLTMLLGRTQPSTGCNTTYIRYDPVTTSWPFSALVVGRTPEGYLNQFLGPSAPICGNLCTIQCTTYVRYGVPPYTITHPWMQNPVTQGNTNNGCSTGAQQVFLNLTVPGCPRICDTTSSITIPAPTVTDACGAVVTGLPTRVLLLKEVPDINASPMNQVICSGDPFTIGLSSCISGATNNWLGNNESGTGTISDTLFNSGTTVNTIPFNAYATYNGCSSDTILPTVDVDPLPLGDFSFTPSPVIAAVSTQFSDISQIFAGTATGWSWDFGDGNTSTQQSPTHVFTDPGNYTVCLTVTTSNGCVDSICRAIEVIAPDVLLPNVVTPNNDNTNDVLSFMYLEAFPENNLQVFSRWGNLIFSKEGYLNDWSPEKLTDGTYYFVLHVAELGKTYSGWFQVLH
ncbi:MAG: gliding motility-associated C-terminal domain-containing protein [Bacteroidia bacterium]|nr:gliding motility-associated C-terminal domain-containing protein [Bacteroidia bacterium]